MVTYDGRSSSAAHVKRLKATLENAVWRKLKCFHKVFDSFLAHCIQTFPTASASHNRASWCLDQQSNPTTESFNWAVQVYRAWSWCRSIRGRNAPLYFFSWLIARFERYHGSRAMHNAYFCGYLSILSIQSELSSPAEPFYLIFDVNGARWALGEVHSSWLLP